MRTRILLALSLLASVAPLACGQDPQQADPGACVVASEACALTLPEYAGQSLSPEEAKLCDLIAAQDQRLNELEAGVRGCLAAAGRSE
jgi:hypothetical protein